MDAQSVDAIADDVVDQIDEDKSFKEALNDVLKSNSDFQKAMERGKWNGVTREQKKALRSRITSDKRTKKVTVKKRDKTYIQVDKNNFRRVLEDDDVVYNPKTDNYYLKTEDNQFKEIIH